MLADTALARLPAAIQATTSAAVQEATSHAWCNGQWRSRKRQATHTKGLKVLVYTFSLVEHSQGKGPHSASSSVKTATQRVPNENMVAGAATLDRQPGSWKLPHARWVVAQSDHKAAWWKAKASLLPTGAGGSGRERVAGVHSNAVWQRLVQRHAVPTTHECPGWGVPGALFACGAWTECTRPERMQNQPMAEALPSRGGASLAAKSPRQKEGTPDNATAK